VILEVRVKTHARVAALERGADGGWVARLRAPPVEGRANAELVALVAAHFGVPKSAVSLRSGHSGRRKRLEIEGL
jgi:uncharacterized protein YggU (UPF0235/DUF167 family)